MRASLPQLSTAVCALALLGAGCLTKTAEPVVLPNYPDRESENMVGEVTVETQALMRSFVLNEFASCTIDIAYPIFPAGSLPPDAQIAVDQEITQFLANTLGSSAEQNAVSDLDQLADESQALCQMEISEEYTNLSEVGEELFTNLKRHIEVVYNVKLNEYHLLSIGLDESSYTGGAHPNHRMTYLNIDRGGGRILTLGDILNAESLRAFLQIEKAKLLADYRESLYPDAAEEFDALIENTKPITAEQQLAAYGDFDDFYLTPTSIVTYYNTYDIAPYAAGPIFVEIPYAEVKDYISMNGPLVPIAEKL